MRVTVSLPDGYRVASASRGVIVENKAKIEIYSPKPDTRIKARGKIRLEYSAQDMGGKMINPKDVRWYSSRDGKTWTAVDLGRDGSIQLPESQGSYYLKAAWFEGEGYPREDQFSYTISK